MTNMTLICPVSFFGEYQSCAFLFIIHKCLYFLYKFTNNKDVFNALFCIEFLERP